MYLTRNIDSSRDVLLGFLVVKLKESLRICYGRHLDHRHVSDASITIWSFLPSWFITEVVTSITILSFLPSWLITGDVTSITIRSVLPSWLITGVVTRITGRIAQEMSSLPERSLLARSLVFCLVFCRSFFALLSVFGCPLSWYLKSFLSRTNTI